MTESFQNREPATAGAGDSGPGTDVGRLNSLGAEANEIARRGVAVTARHLSEKPDQFLQRTVQGTGE
jgi:hypothetical protein